MGFPDCPRGRLSLEGAPVLRGSGEVTEPSGALRSHHVATSRLAPDPSL